jgi:hypothetical protein
MKPKFWKLKVKILGIGPYGVFNKSNLPTQFVNFSHMDSPYQQ